MSVYSDEGREGDVQMRFLVSIDLLLFLVRTSDSNENNPFLLRRLPPLTLVHLKDGFGGAIPHGQGDMAKVVEDERKHFSWEQRAVGGGGKA